MDKDNYWVDNWPKSARLHLFRSQKQEAIKKFAKEYYYDKIIEHTEEMCDYIPDSIKEDVFKYASRRSRKSRYNYVMFTINFKPDVTVEQALKKFEKYKRKKWIDKEYSCMEWRDYNKGMHIHSKVWINEDKKCYRCKGEVYNTFKDLVGNKMHVYANYSNVEGCFDEYIQGKKKGKPKDSNTITLKMRRKYNMKAIL